MPASISIVSHGYTDKLMYKASLEQPIDFRMCIHLVLFVSGDLCKTYWKSDNVPRFSVC